MGFPGGASGKEPAYQCRRFRRHGFNPWVKKVLCRRKRQPTPVFLPGKFHGQRNLVGFSPYSWIWSDTTEGLTCPIDFLEIIPESLSSVLMRIGFHLCDRNALLSHREVALPFLPEFLDSAI